eukprot:1173962-Prorocentrum_minimum.AAC.1
MPRARKLQGAAPPPLLRLVLTLGITASPPAIGSHAGYIPPPPLVRLVLTLGLYRLLPSCDWLSRWVYTAFPPAIGSHA